MIYSVIENIGHYREALPFQPVGGVEAPCSRAGSFYGHFLHRGVGWHGEALGLEVYAGHLDGKDGWQGWMETIN